MEMDALPKVLIYALPMFALTVAIEWALVRRGMLAGRYAWRDALTSMVMGVGNTLADIAFGALALSALLWLWQFRLFDWGLSVPVIALALLAQDAFYYWKHRFMHRIRWFWSAHVVHHSSEFYNLSTALRQPWNNHFTGLVLTSAPLVILGIHPLLVGFVAGLNLLYQYWIHTEAIDRMPRWFEFVFNTPSHHRVHHSTHPEHLDKNYAGILIIWDRMFGTFADEAEVDEPMRYGLVQNVNTYNPLKIAFREMLSVLRDAVRPGVSLRGRLGSVFGPPGWSPDGHHNRSEEIVEAYRASGQPGE